MKKQDAYFLKLVLRQGSVFYFKHRGLTSSDSHYFIVLNAQPMNSGPILFMTVATSNCTRVKNTCAHTPGTCVIIPASDYGDFTKQTAIDCNSIFEMSIEEFSDKLIKRKEARPHADMPATIMQKILNGVNASRVVEQDIKNVIL